MKKSLAILLLTGIFLTACSVTATKQAGTAQTSASSKPSDQVLDNSIFAEATGSGNLARCKDILDSALKASCEQVIGDKAATSAAFVDLDKSKCSKVTDERYRKECEKQVDGKVEEKNAEEKRISAEQEAIKTGDANLCDKVADINQRYSCKYNVLANQALAKKDPSLCEEIGRKDLVVNCKDALSKQD